ncbi:hypothetical protein MAP00_000180 [Monascus purpureus]|nr:hypothetical protein MAP00_000180 [Monascus purpureus]
MKGICNPEDAVGEFEDRELDVIAERAEFVKDQLGNWSFAAHDFTEDELAFAACEMLRHGFDVPGLERWRLSPDELRKFILACRSAYNSFVLYHNFRHAIDVLQSIFCFLLHIGALAPYGSFKTPPTKSPIVSLLTPFDALTLLISAIGHDVGHPGVNNVFLIKLNAPLAQLYNDNSVLEAFHCAAFSQILRRYWPAAFKEPQLRKLLISSILATDMGIHHNYMERLAALQEKFHHDGGSLDGWKQQDIDSYKALVCGLLIKCADISNVARPWDVAEEWTKILQEEFANQGEMEKAVGLETALFGGPPEIGNVYKLATGQIGFMSIFALPLFEGVSDLLPQMSFTVDQIRTNQQTWQKLAEREKQKQAHCLEKVFSPRSGSPDSNAKVSGPNQGSGGSDDPQDLSQAEHTAVNGTGANGHADGSPHSRSAFNEDTSDSVSSPNCNNIPLAEMPSRKSSSAIPADIAMLAIGEAPQDDSGLTGLQHSTDSDAAADASSSVYDENASTAADSTDTTSERPSSSRHGHHSQHRHQADNSSSGGASYPSSYRQSCAQRHSVSTRSNTVMTPISPATNATSFLTVDSGDELGPPGVGVIFKENGFLKHDDLMYRPSSSEHYPMDGGEDGIYYHTTDQRDLRKSAVTTTVLGNEQISPPRSTTAENAEHEGRNEDEGVNDGNPPPHRLPKRRSRLRLAFWKRKGHFLHRQEVSNET